MHHILIITECTATGIYMNSEKMPMVKIVLDYISKCINIALALTKTKIDVI